MIVVRLTCACGFDNYVEKGKEVCPGCGKAKDAPKPKKRSKKA